MLNQPSHVPNEAVLDFDLHRDPELFTDPHKRIYRLHDEKADLFWSPHNGGHWIVTGYEAVHQAARDVQRFTSNTKQMLEAGDR